MIAIAQGEIAKGVVLMKITPTGGDENTFKLIPGMHIATALGPFNKTVY
jgi:hypothetical protein